MTISILLVDDHAVFRESVRAVLETAPDFHIVGEAGCGKEALKLAEQLHPDVVVLDYKMPDMNGSDVAWHLAKTQDNINVIILSMHNDEFYVLMSLINGASGYILKEDIVRHLASAVTAAAAGQFYFSPNLIKQLPVLELVKTTVRLRDVAPMKRSI